MSYIHIGPVAIRVGTKGLASWGYDMIHVGGLSIGSRVNDGSLNLISYHPRSSLTWLWFVNLRREPNRPRRPRFAHFLRHWSLDLPFGWTISAQTQDRMPRCKAPTHG